MRTVLCWIGVLRTIYVHYYCLCVVASGEWTLSEPLEHSRVMCDVWCVMCDVIIWWEMSDDSETLMPDAGCRYEATNQDSTNEDNDRARSARRCWRRSL